ncbi:MAG: hypothetical protein NZ898_08685 [Myxococcota bacterium]|nr:hypothetical protein [Myxococcota bacterium]MDW8363109.1 hypothetical protein [Myxococcales bacterium]
MLLRSEPPADATDVPRGGPFVVWFDRTPAPASVHRGSVRLESGATRHPLAVRVDPVERRIVAVPLEGVLLEPQTTYRLRLEGIRGFDGVEIEPVEIRFRTGREAGEPSEESRPTPSWSRIRSLLTRSCATAGCHDERTRAVGLDLGSAEGVETTAIGVPARGVAAPVSGEGTRAASVLVGLPLIDVVAGAGRPAWSYLVYKVTGEPGIAGEPMPPPASGLPELSLEERHLLAGWIAAGAPTSEEGHR